MSDPVRATGELRIALSTGPATRFATNAIANQLEARRFRVELFSADGIGGRLMEQAILNQRFAAVIDFTLVELVAELFDGLGAAGRDRMTAAARVGIPMVLVPGGCDVVASSIGQRKLADNEADLLAKDIAQKASASNGPVSIIVPMVRWSETEKLDPDTARIFCESLHLWRAPQVSVRTMNGGVGDHELVDLVCSELLRLTSADPCPTIHE